MATLEDLSRLIAQDIKTRGLSSVGRLPAPAVAHVGELITAAAPYKGPWQDITELFDVTVASTRTGIRIRRHDDRIIYTFTALRLVGTAGTILPWGSLPVGYRPTWAQYGGLQSTTGVGALDITVNTGGGLVATGGTSSATYRGNFTVYTTAAPPTTHPGTIL